MVCRPDGGGKSARIEIVFHRGLGPEGTELRKVERKQFDRVMAAGQRGAEFSGEEMGIGAGDYEPSLFRAIELGPQPSLPAVHPLHFVEQVGASGAPIGLEAIDEGLERCVVERLRQPGVFEIDEQALRAVESVAVDQLLEKGRFTAAAHPLHDQRDVRTELPGQRHAPHHGTPRRHIPMAPIRGDLKEESPIHAVEFT